MVIPTKILNATEETWVKADKNLLHSIYIVHGLAGEALILQVVMRKSHIWDFSFRTPNIQTNATQYTTFYLEAI